MITADVIVKLLQMKHSDREWATFTELPNAPAYDIAKRRMDFFALNTWPSKRFQSIGYEIKISRADFLHEMKQPEKREYIEKYCNMCYFVIPSGMVKIDEIPEGWGLYEVGAGGLRETKSARFHEIESYPIEFFASVARRSCDNIDDVRTSKVEDTLLKRIILLGEETLTIKEAVDRLLPCLNEAYAEKHNLIPIDKDKSSRLETYISNLHYILIDELGLDYFSLKNKEGLDIVRKAIRQAKSGAIFNSNDKRDIKSAISTLENLFRRHQDLEVESAVETE